MILPLWWCCWRQLRASSAPPFGYQFPLEEESDFCWEVDKGHKRQGELRAAPHQLCPGCSLPRNLCTAPSLLFTVPLIILSPAFPASGIAALPGDGEPRFAGSSLAVLELLNQIRRAFTRLHFTLNCVPGSCSHIGISLMFPECQRCHMCNRSASTNAPASLQGAAWAPGERCASPCGSSGKLCHQNAWKRSSSRSWSTEKAAEV